MEPRGGFDPLLVLRAQARDEAAFEELLRHSYARVGRYIASIVRDPGLAEDINQEVWFLAWRKLPHLSDPAAFQPWIFRIASRAANKRRIKEDSALERYGGEEDRIERRAAETEAPPLDRTEWPALQAQLDSLPPGARKVLQLHYGADLTLDEVAASLEIPRGTARSRLAYGLTLLRARVRGNESQ